MDTQSIETLLKRLTLTVRLRLPFKLRVDSRVNA